MSNMKDMAARSMADQTGNMGLTQTENQKKTGIMAMLEAGKARIADGLPQHLTIERILRVANTALTKSPKLLECHQDSIINAVIIASQMGLECDGTLNHGHLIPYWNKKTKRQEAQFIIGYGGYVDLGYRSKMLSNIHADVVRVGDIFSYEFGTHGHLKHIYADDRGEITHFYCYTKHTNGGEGYTVLPKKKVDEIKANTGAKFGPWFDNYESMGIKTAVRHHAYKAKMPLSIEMAKAASHMENDEYGEKLANAIPTSSMVVPEPKQLSQPPEPDNKPDAKPKKPKKTTPPKQEQFTQDPKVDPIALMEAHNTYTLVCGELDSVGGRDHANKFLFTLFKTTDQLGNATIEQLTVATKKVQEEMKRIKATGDVT